jgi:hypothetical protein
MPVLTILIFPKMLFVMIYLVVTITVTKKEMIVWTVFLDFWIQGVDLQLRLTVFTVLIYSGFIRSDVESCHGRIEQICPQRITSDTQYFHNFSIPSWVHVFGKSIKLSSFWTQCASVVYRELPTTKNVRHCCNRRARKKLKKQESLLTEATVPQPILTNLLSTHEINKEIIVFDGGTLEDHLMA